MSTRPKGFLNLDKILLQLSGLEGSAKPYLVVDAQLVDVTQTTKNAPQKA